MMSEWWFGFTIGIAAGVTIGGTAIAYIVGIVREEDKAVAAPKDEEPVAAPLYKMPVNSPFSLSVKDVTENTRPATEPPTSREAPESIRRMLRR
jgi:hypothetical protein